MAEAALFCFCCVSEHYDNSATINVQLISIHAPREGRDLHGLRLLLGRDISIHAPRAGRDSKSIQNYFTHFCDKRQFLDNFTQNAAF